MAANAGGVALAVVPPRRRSRLDCVDDWSQDGDASAQLAADVAGGRATALQGEVVKCRLSVRDEALIGRVERPPQPSEQDAAQREQPLAGHEDQESRLLKGPSLASSKVWATDGAFGSIAKQWFVAGALLLSPSSTISVVEKIGSPGQDPPSSQPMGAETANPFYLHDGAERIGPRPHSSHGP